MVYYPLSTLMLAGIRDILLISTPHDLPAFERRLRNGSELGIKITYAAQPRPEGLAQAFTIGADFVGDQRVALVLGDNIFDRQGFRKTLDAAAAQETGATIFGYQVTDHERYGAAEFDADGRVISIEKKPAQPKSNDAVAPCFVVGAD